MRVKFLVLLAVLFLTVALSDATEPPRENKHGVKKHSAKYGHNKSAKGHKHGKGHRHRHVSHEVVEVEEVHTIKNRKENEEHNHNKKKIEIKKEVTKKVAKKIPCVEVTQPKRLACDERCKGFIAKFSHEDNEFCDWKCDCLPNPTQPPTKKTPKKKVVKKLKQKEPKPTKERKECSGEKKISFSNCLVKITGLIAWGDKTKDFDKKFTRLVARKKKKVKNNNAKKQAKGNKKPAKGNKKPAKGNRKPKSIR